MTIGIILTGLALAQAAEVKVGAGSYRDGLFEGAKGPDAAPRRAASLKGAVPTNDWSSAVLWSDKPFPQFPHPLAVVPEAAGLRIGLPVVKGTPRDIFGSMPGAGRDLVLGHAKVDVFPAPLAEALSDWFITLGYTADSGAMHVSYGHGSPYVFASFEKGEPRLTFAEVPKIWSGNASSAVLGISCGTTIYGLFAPAGARWEGLDSKTWLCHTERSYFSLAALPDAKPETLALFAKHAHNHVTDTQVRWKFDPATATVTTDFRHVTRAMQPGGDGTLFALYPHQWRYSDTPLTGHTFASVRGTMKLGAGSGFSTRYTFPGVLPALPDAGGVEKERLTRLLDADTAKPLPAAFGDTYWEGKQLGRLATLSGIAEAHGQNDRAQALHETLAKRLEGWFSAGEGKSRGLFAYEPKWGSLIGYPASFGSDDQLNDHHFHYGYFIRAAAEIARRDPAWAAEEKWGGMVKLLIREIASPDRKDPLFPFLRTFDPYAGHTWASGHARFGDGNNNESSSEAMNAWAGVTLFGEATGDTALRDLGAWLFTTELHAIEENWFNVHGDNFAAGYEPPVVTMVWGGKGVHGTWFSGNPEAIHGINWLPVTAASLYLGRWPDYAEKNYRALISENLDDDAKKAAKSGKPNTNPDGTHWDNWPDVIRQFRALTDATDALAQETEAAKASKIDIEAGNSHANVVTWIESLSKLGQVDRTVTANTTCYAVFSKSGRRSHVAWNLSDKPHTVRFSDGVELTVPPRKSAVK